MFAGKNARSAVFVPVWAGWILFCACGGGIGDEGSQISVPFGELAGGIVFASKAFEESAGYDLYWAPAPAPGVSETQAPLRLTEIGGDEVQPSSSPGGNGIAFARSNEGIFLIDREGKVRRISDSRGTGFVDSNPAVSWDGSHVAWEREDTGRQIGDFGFFETFIMIARADGREARALHRSGGVVQTSPRFEPTRTGTRVVFSEFDARSVGANGPTDFGIRLFDYVTQTEQYLCRGQQVVIGGLGYRCFGLHLAWPTENKVVIPQNFLELYLDGSPPTASFVALVDSITSQNLGAPYITAPGAFFAPFPLSASYENLDRMVVDGVVASADGNGDTLAFFIARVDGTDARRLHLRGHQQDLDATATNDFLFSLATPQFILPRQE